MSSALPVIYLARHGETARTLSHQHTGVSDLPLTTAGEAEAVRLGERLAGRTFAAVFTSPLRRAGHTRELARFRSFPVGAPALVAWDYRPCRRSRRAQTPDSWPDCPC